MRMHSLTFWIAIAFAPLLGTPLTPVWGQPAPDNALNSFIVVPLLGGTLIPLNGILRRGTICGLGHTTNFPNPVCAGRTIQQHAPNGNCPPGYNLVQLCDFGASSGTNFFACMLADDMLVSTLPEGLLCGYGHTGQPPPSCQGNTILENHPETCPSGYVYIAYGDLGASRGQGFFGCVLTTPTPVQASDDALPSGGVCGLSHTCGGPVGHFCGPIQVRPSADGCPAGYALSPPVDFGASSGEGQYYCHSCSPGQYGCGGVCKNLANDAQNCGACGNVCRGGEVCQNGQCLCPDGLVNCGGMCRNLVSDGQNCGACGIVCSARHICQDSHCICQPGTRSCPGDVCANVTTDPQNCGACGKVCPSTHVCQNGMCTCGSGGMECNGICKNIVSDPQNCGGCNKLCGGGQACCNGQCKDLSADGTNCGQCGNICPQTCAGTRTCISGVCRHQNTYTFLVEYSSTKCPATTVPEQASTDAEAMTCAQNVYPPPSYTVGLSAQFYTFAVSCPDPGGETSTCSQYTTAALSPNDAKMCTQSQYRNCNVSDVGGQCPPFPQP
jgi:hypothetical protein